MIFRTEPSMQKIIQFIRRLLTAGQDSGPVQNNICSLNSSAKLKRETSDAV